MALHALVYVKDLERCVEFYGTVLGMTPQQSTRTEHFAEFDLDGPKLMLHAIPPHVAAGITVTSPPEVREDTPVKLIIDRWASDPIDAATVTGLGGRVLERPWGNSDYADPEGNVFGVSYFR